MSTTLFKLSQRDGFTRRLAFPTRPTWDVLALKIHSLYSIPLENVAVAYIDADGDEVTLSSQEELQDFYQVSCRPGEVIRFFVQDMSSSRRSQNTAHPEATNPNFGGVFATIDPADEEDGWQRLQAFSSLGDIFGPSNPVSESHAFVEVLPSDAGSVLNQIDGDKNGQRSVATSHEDDVPRRSSDKGKAKLINEDDISSTGSVLAANAPPKHPLHVYDMNSRSQDAHGADSYPQSIPDHSNDHTLPIIAESTPKAPAHNLHTPNDGTTKPSLLSPDFGAHEDPPLPDLDPSNPSGIDGSLTSDIASLINVFSNVIAAHPELSEGIQNIIRNASSGTYWNVHRQNMSRAAESFIQSAGDFGERQRRVAEEEAGKRITDALNNMFRALTHAFAPNEFNHLQTAVPHPTSAGESFRLPEDKPSQPSAGPASFWYGSSPHVRPPSERQSGTFHQHASWMRSRPPFSHPLHRFGPWAHPPSHHASPLGPHEDPSIRDLGAPAQQTPASVIPLVADLTQEKSNPISPSPNDSKLSPQELKAQVEAAKSRYKAEKEKYRREREERRKERERKVYEFSNNITKGPLPPVNDTSTNAAPQNAKHTKFVSPDLHSGSPANKPVTIVSHGRGDYPTFELVSVRRNNTHPGHMHHIDHSLEHTDAPSRTIGRISKKLTDMGFSENTYPDLSSKIKSHVPSSGVVSKDTEDEIVTMLLEELLAASPKPHISSGSDERDVPGAWH